MSKKAAKEYSAVKLNSKVENEERVVLFAIDDEEYTIPKRNRPNIGLKYLKTLRDQGSDVAQAELLIAIIGEKGYDALCNCDSLTEENFADILGYVQEVALGGMEDGAKN